MPARCEPIRQPSPATHSPITDTAGPDAGISVAMPVDEVDGHLTKFDVRLLGPLDQALDRLVGAEICSASPHKGVPVQIEGHHASRGDRGQPQRHTSPQSATLQ